MLNSEVETLLSLVELVSNINTTNIKKKHPEILEIVTRCNDISIYRNCLIHNAGKTNSNFIEKVKIYKQSATSTEIIVSKDMIISFVNDYLKFYEVLKIKILKNTHFVPKPKLKIEKLRHLWSICFKSPLLNFDDYWEVDSERDLVTNIKFSDFENSISSGEKVYLSIWRHQFFSPIKTEDFLLCSISIDTLHKIYCGLDEVRFYHMYQQSRMT